MRVNLGEARSQIDKTRTLINGAPSKEERCCNLVDEVQIKFERGQIAGVKVEGRLDSAHKFRTIIFQNPLSTGLALLPALT